MLNLIVGQNTIGKTAYLRQLLSAFGFNNCTTNMFRDKAMPSDVGFDKDRLYILRDVMDGKDIYVSGTDYLTIISEDIPLTREFNDIMTIMCKDKKILILDEPDLGINAYEEGKLLDMIAHANKTFDDMYIVTHNESFFALPEFNVLTITGYSDGKLQVTQVMEEDGYEIID